jgi:hypothetical protein
VRTIQRVLAVILVRSAQKRKCAVAAKIKAQKSATIAKKLIRNNFFAIATHRIF